MGKYTESLQRVAHALDRGLTVYIHGQPGIGKTYFAARYAAERQRELITLRLAQIESVDLRGPFAFNHETRTAHYYRPEFLPVGEDGKKYMLFLDEFNMADEDTERAAMELIERGQVGGARLPHDTAVLCAGNLPEQNILARHLALPTLNRMVHVVLEPPSIDEWLQWAYETGIDFRINAFLSWKPSLLAPPMNADGSAGKLAQPSPRSWEYCSRLIEGVNHDLTALAAMAVGEGAAYEFGAFVALTEKLPDPKAVLKDPKLLPEEMSQRYALIMLLVECTDPHKDIVPLCKVARALGPEMGLLLLHGIRLRVGNVIWLTELYQKNTEMRKLIGDWEKYIKL